MSEETVDHADVDVVVIGAGQAGLSAAWSLHRAGFVGPHDDNASARRYVVLDANAGPGGAWQHRWPTLVLGKVHGLHALPGMDFDGGDPEVPASEVVAEYFGRYEQRFELPVRRPVVVHAVQRTDDDRFRVETNTGTWRTRTLINATGTWTKPFVPYVPGIETFAGRQLHTAQYRGPEEFAGQHVIVVGGGTSAVQLLMAIATTARTTWVTRREPVFRDEPFTQELGRAAVAMVDQAVRAGRPPASVVSVTGLPMTDEMRAAREAGVLVRRPIFDRITPSGVAWDNGETLDTDVILWCTGFRAALDHLAPLHLRAAGGGIVMDGSRVVADPRIHLVGYGPSASTIGANRAGRVAVRDLERLLDAQDSQS